MSDSFVTTWNVVLQAPLFMELPKQDYWSELPFPLQEIFPTQGSILYHLQVMAGGFFIPLSHLGSSLYCLPRDQFLWPSIQLIYIFFKILPLCFVHLLSTAYLQDILIPHDHQQFIWCWGKVEKEVHSLPGRTGAELGTWWQRQQGQVGHSPLLQFF